MDGQKTTGERWRLQFGLRLMLLLVALAAVCSATFKALLDLSWQMREPTRAAERDEVYRSLREKKWWVEYAKEQNRLWGEENWLQRFLRTSQAPPFTEKEIQRLVKEADEATAEAEETLRKIGQK
jgi:hypothetical protein